MAWFANNWVGVLVIADTILLVVLLVELIAIEMHFGRWGPRRPS